MCDYSGVIEQQGRSIEVLDFSSLRNWIAEEHLRPDTVAEYRNSFQENPAKLLVVRDLFHREIADKVGRFLTRYVQFERIFGLYSKILPYGELPEVEWRAASDSDRFYRFGRFAGLPAESQIYSVPLIALDLRKRLGCSVSRSGT